MYQKRKMLVIVRKRSSFFHRNFIYFKMKLLISKFHDCWLILQSRCLFTDGSVIDYFLIIVLFNILTYYDVFLNSLQMLVSQMTMMVYFNGCLVLWMIVLKYLNSLITITMIVIIMIFQYLLVCIILLNLFMFKFK